MSDLQAVVSQPFVPVAGPLVARPGGLVRDVLVQAINAGMLTQTDLACTVVHLNGKPLARSETLATILQADDVLNIVVEPLGGGGGGKKDVGQALFQIAVMVAAFAIAGPGGALATQTALQGTALLLTQAAAAAAITTAGQFIGAAIFKPESQGGASGDRYALQSASNQYRPWSSMPLALGACVVAPDLAVKTFTRAIGDDVWIYGILGLHYGPCVATEMRIGDTLVSSLPAGEIETVEHLTPGPRTFSLYPNDTDEQGFTDELNEDGTTVVVHAAGAEGELFELDLFLPEGLYFAKDDGRVETASVTVTVRRREIDAFGVPTGSWTAAGTTALSNRTREPVRATHSVSLPLGRYEFELKRSAPPDASEKRHDTVILTAIRAIAFRKPIVDETLSVIEFRVKASAVNQGTLAPITCRIEPVCSVWNGSNWSTTAATSNPAALVRWLLTGPAPAKPLLTSQADTGLRAWSETCVTRGWTAGLYLTDRKSQRDALKLLETAGRAGLWWDGSRMVAACWAERPAPKQIFNGRNLRDRSGTIVYPEPVHALRVEFANIDRRGEADEIIVYATGYAAVAGGGLLAASRLEAWRVEGQCTRTRALKDGVWELTRRTLQRRVETWTTDVEHVACSFGDRVLVSWRAVGEGLGEARVRAVRTAGGLVTGLRLDQEVEMTTGVAYACDMRFMVSSGGGSGPTAVRGVDLVNTPGSSREIVFATPRAVADCPRPDDLITWGVATTLSSDLEIVGIEPSEDLTARITARKYVAPALIAAEDAAGTPSPSTLTGDRTARPPAPVLLGVQGAASGVRVSFSIPPWAGSPITGIAARWRVTPETPNDQGWVELPMLSASARDLTTPPPRLFPALTGEVEDAPIDVELVVVVASGQTSEPLLVEAIAIERVVNDPTTDPALDLTLDGNRLVAGRSGDVLFWFGSDTVQAADAEVANADFALGTDGKTYRQGIAQDELYSEMFTSSPVTVSGAMADIVTFTLAQAVTTTAIFNVSMGLNISTPTPRTRSSSTTVAPSGAWEIWELPVSGTTNQRKVDSGTWSSAIIGGGGSPQNIESLEIDGEGDHWSDLSRQWRFRHGGAERFVLKMSATGADLIDVVLTTRLSIQKF
ncbi:hypothetical protein KOAAANKH_00091 [Brevundimonas sp. NIBR10]|uniref:TipJ family phage tail tip protein n=1 Tax=Brevundimonas sp. NIBR10 TaxID=3015997 RepID=UPI0022F18683|nr:hypothetical protein [Brevundimonas sp. NIBR10]WGM45230.1 hypothetical protein KOAAANKH_00091 [Brevundimonas sp. NIBR10]